MENFSNKKHINGYAACKKCYTVLTAAAANTGTRHLNVHAAFCKASESQSKILKFVSRPDKKLQQSDLEDVKESIVKFIAMGHNSFKSVESEGLKQLCQTMVKIGASHGNVDVETFFPSRITVKKNCDQKRAEIKKAIKSFPPRPAQLYVILN